ncbi:cytochrome c family protein [Acidocella sp.]|uniref:c-type cytochrome n=1 Tax=Acidocella sp. TaxID=50710 RepID=UPI0017A8CA4D|nr:c-type cytochrome [Acidocella sp.]NNM57528.1 c-type cytochrome [Acidocella sp.]
MSGKGKDSLLGNKIAAGLLTAGLIFWGANRIASIVVPSEAPKTPAINVPGLQTAAAPVVAAAAGLESIIPLIATGDVAKGAAFVQQQCAACHTLTSGGAAGVGPNLYGVMGSPMFSGSFAYSDAVKDKAKGNWNYDNINAWLAAPMTFAPGTGMSYAGIKNVQTRADVVAYLRTLSANPLPLPTADEIKAATAAPAATGAPATAAATAPAATAEAAPSIDTLFATADLAKGKALVMQQCAACHTLAKGGAPGVGPNLYGIVGAKSFSAPGFNYSAAVKGKAGATWTDDTLSAWLENPMGYAPGTMMAYPGIKNAQTRADVIAYLNSNSDKPEKLP